MGLPKSGVGGYPTVTGVIYNDHEGAIYGPHLSDVSVGLNGFLSGRSVTYIEHVFDDYNAPPASSQGLPENTYPDPIFAIPFGAGTPINAGDGARFQHVYRRGDCSPDVPAFEGTDLDLIGISWAPIGGWVNSTLIEELAIVVSDSDIIPDTHQSAGIPDNMASGLTSRFVDNYLGTPTVVLGVQHANGTGYGVPYNIDWRNLYTPKNAGQSANTYLSWPAFDKPTSVPGFSFRSENSLLIEYRMDPNITTTLDPLNGFTFHAGIISSMLPRFRVYIRGGGANPSVWAASNAGAYTQANGPLQWPGSYGDNSRYFMIFDYVKRLSLVESPYLTGPEIGTADLEFLNPIFTPGLDDIPDGTALSVRVENTPNPDNPGAPTSGWVAPESVEDMLNQGAFANYDYIRFQAVFEANVEEMTRPALDTVVFPYRILDP